MAQYKLGKRSMKKLVGVHPALAQCVLHAISISKHDFSVIEGVRTMETQRRYVRTGKSKTMDSYHLYGLAVDLCPYKSGVGLVWNDMKAYKEVSRAMHLAMAYMHLDYDGVHLINGGEAWGWDYPHWQLSGLKSKYDIRSLAIIKTV